MKLRSVMCALAIVNTALMSDELESKKQELERQIQELEAKQQRQNEIENLQKRLQELQAKDALQDENKPQPNYTHQPPPPAPQTTQTNTQAQNLPQPPIKEDNYRKGVLLGIGLGGMSAETKNTFSINGDSYIGTLSGDLLIPSFRLGYQSFGSNDSKIGSRFYIDYAFGSANTENKEGRITQSLWSLNLDLLLDIRIPETKAFMGLILGVGYGRLNYKSTSTYTITQSSWFGLSNDTYHYKQELELGLPTPFINAGLSIGGTKHRLEFYTKIPTTSEYNEKFYYKAKPLLSAVYQYTF